MDKWSGYKPIDKVYNTTQIESNNVPKFTTLQTIIHEVKSRIKTTKF